MTTICIITALAAESRSYIDTFKLRHIESRGLRLYGSEHCLLLQTGVGKLKAAAATAAILQARPEIRAIINAGIAGGTATRGEVLMGHQIVDSATGAQWFPHLPPKRVTPQLATSAIHTLDVPCTEYRHGVLFDMEAAAVFSAASTYLTTDSLHSIKVISDNKQQAVDSITTDHVVELMQNTTPVVSRLIEWLSGRFKEDPLLTTVTGLCKSIETRVHHTVSERHQLHRLLQQYASMAGVLPELATFDGFQSARQIKHHLVASLSSVPFTYGT